MTCLIFVRRIAFVDGNSRQTAGTPVAVGNKQIGYCSWGLRGAGTSNARTIEAIPIVCAALYCIHAASIPLLA